MVSVDRNRRDRRAGAAGRIDRARDQRRRDEGTRGVVDQHDVGLLRARALRARHAPRPAASRRPASAARGCKPAHGRIEHRDVVGVQHRLHGRHIRMPAERLHGAVDHGLAADRAVLLRSAGAGAQARGRRRQGWRQYAVISPWDFNELMENARSEGRLRGMPLSWRRAKTRELPRAVRKAHFAALHLQDQQNCLKCRHAT